jgi:ubiquitin-like 1-activating enzyme E1 B
VSFDKDDDLAMHFISAVSNLRAEIYHIPMESEFNVKAIAGNIVPAIATTNAIISGTAVLEAIKILEGRLKDCRMTFCGPVAKSFRRKPTILYPSEAVGPNPKCYICNSSMNQLEIKLDTNITTLGYFVKEILQNQLSLAEPCVDGPKGGIYDHEVHQGHAKLQKPLKDVGITAEACLTVMDTLQDLEFEVTIHHINCSDPSEFVMAGDVDAKASAPQSGGAPVAAQESDDDDDVIEYHAKDVVRKRKAADVASPSAKRQKVETVDILDD